MIPLMQRNANDYLCQRREPELESARLTPSGNLGCLLAGLCKALPVMNISQTLPMTRRQLLHSVATGTAAKVKLRYARGGVGKCCITDILG